MQLEVGVKVFLRNNEGKYLLLQRTKPYFGESICRWDIPGGRIGPGETQLNALQREIREETGFNLGSDIKLLAVQDILKVKGKHVVRITYQAQYLGEEEIRLNKKEHVAYQWIGLKDIKKIQYDTFLNEILGLLE